MRLPILAPLLAACTLVGAARAQDLDVSGTARIEDEALVVRVELTSHGAAEVPPLRVEGELAGRRDEGVLQGIAPGGSGAVRLRFPPEVGRPGVHALLLRIEDARAGDSPRPGRCAYLLLALGGQAPPAVRLDVPDRTITYKGWLDVGLRSADGAPHRVRLRAFAPHALAVPDPPLSVQVPAAGATRARVRVIRAGAPWGSTQGVVIVAGAEDGEEERTAVTTAAVRVGPDPAWMPRLRVPILALSLALLALAGVLELRRRRPPPPLAPDEPAS